MFLKNYWKRCTLAAIVVLILGGSGCEYFDSFGNRSKSTDFIKLSVSYNPNGFAPTPEQLETYLLLRADLHAAVLEGDFEAVAVCKKHMAAIVEIARGKVPSVGVYSASEGNRITEADRQEFLRKEIESGRYQRKLDQAYRDYGLSHLIGVDLSDAYPVIQPTIPAPPRRLKLPPPNEPNEPTEPTAPTDDR